jgi:hypothetical protein
MRQIVLSLVASSLALGAPFAGGVAAAEVASVENSGHVVHDLGLLPPPANSDHPTPEPVSASEMNSAEPVPELPTWAIMLLCFIGLALAGYKKSRRDRLSPGLE